MEGFSFGDRRAPDLSLSVNREAEGFEEEFVVRTPELTRKILS
jgi:hypothetical protein